MIKKGVILLSGGIDSATTAAIAREQGFSLSALIFDYGQKHGIEIKSARNIAQLLEIDDCHVIVIPSEIFRSALTDEEISIPDNREIDPNDQIPATYVPARNIIFLSYGLAYAESIGANNIFIGANAIDYSGYPDCRPEFIRAFQEMANTGTRTGVEGKGFKIEAPLMELSKTEIIEKGSLLGIDYSMTHSCYNPDPEGYACGSCDSCRIRSAGFHDAGIPDPTKYRP
jgi:7-cyano-7-deazaguanine synthase